MTHARILWRANGPILKMEGNLAGEWAEEARCLLITGLVPKGLIVDLTDVSYVDSAGERLLSGLGSVGAVFVASSVYAIALCRRLGLSPMQSISVGGMRARRRIPQLRTTIEVGAAQNAGE